MMVYKIKALEGQFKIILDICSLGCALRVSTAHLIYAIHWTTIYTWNLKRERGQYKQNVIVKRQQQVLVIFHHYVVKVNGRKT